MMGLPVPMLRPGGSAKPSGGKDAYGGMAGAAMVHGSVESESWKSRLSISQATATWQW